MTSPPPPIPTHILRSHISPVSVLSFSDDNERIYSGDASGRVVVTSTRSFRAIAIWNAHTNGLLGVEEWNNQVLTHGRDNKIHVWTRLEELPASARVGDSASLPDLPVPDLCYSMDVNALNFCRFSLMKLSPPEVGSSGEGSKAMLALPNLIDSSVADIWSLPNRQRLHGSVGQEVEKSIFSETGGRNNAGIIMSLHVFAVPRSQPLPGATGEELRLLCAYENGAVTLRKYTRTDKQESIKGVGWENIWTSKVHVEAIMAMRVSRDNMFALTVSADHIVGRYELSDNTASAGTPHRTKHPGNGAVAIRDDGRVYAIAGWDGRIRLYATRTMKALGTLKYHKSNCQVVEFARSLESGAKINLSDEDEEMTEEEQAERARWLISGAKDNRVAIWTLIDFQRS